MASREKLVGFCHWVTELLPWIGSFRVQMALVVLRKAAEDQEAVTLRDRLEERKDSAQENVIALSNLARSEMVGRNTESSSDSTNFWQRLALSLGMANGATGSRRNVPRGDWNPMFVQELEKSASLMTERESTFVRTFVLPLANFMDCEIQYFSLEFLRQKQSNQEDLASLYEKVTLDIKHVRELLQREFAIEDSEFELNSRDVSCIDEAIGCLQIIPDLVYLRLRMINFYRSISNSGGVISDFEKKLFDANEVSSALISMLAHKSFSMYIKHFFFEVDIYRGLLEVENHLENFRYLETIIQITITRQKLGEWQDEMSKCHSQYIHDNFFKLTKKLLVPSIFLWFSSAFSSQLGRATLFFHCILKDHAVSLNESLAFLWKSQKTDYIGWIENAVSKFNATSFMLCLDSRNLSHVTLDDKKHPKGYELPLEIDSSNQESVADENLAGLDRFPFVYNHPESRDLREFKADIVSLLFQIEENSSRDKVYHFRENARFRRTYLMCQMSKNITAVLVFSESKSRKSCLEAIEFLMKLGKKLRITSAVKHLVTRNPNSSLVVDLSVLTKHL